MEDFSPEKDRLKEARQAATLARLRAAAPGAVDRIEAAAQAEPDPVAVHIGILRRRFPSLRFLRHGWPVGLPDLRVLGGIAELAAYFSPAAMRRRQAERVFRIYFDSSPDDRKRIEIATLGHPLRRRSPWSRLAFWR